MSRPISVCVPLIEAWAASTTGFMVLVKVVVALGVFTAAALSYSVSAPRTSACIVPSPLSETITLTFFEVSASFTTPGMFPLCVIRYTYVPGAVNSTFPNEYVPRPFSSALSLVFLITVFSGIGAEGPLVAVPMVYVYWSLIFRSSILGVEDFKAHVTVSSAETGLTEYEFVNVACSVTSAFNLPFPRSVTVTVTVFSESFRMPSAVPLSLIV